MIKRTLRYPIPNKLPGEEVIYFVRKHWSYVLYLSLLCGFLVVGWAVILILLKVYAPTIFISFLGPIIIISGIFLLALCIFFLTSWMTYYFDIVILTTRRLIEIEQKRLFERAINEVQLVHVEDITVGVKGILATFFGYGSITAQTAGAKPNFVLNHIPHPYVFAREISAHYDRLTLENHQLFDRKASSFQKEPDTEVKPPKAFPGKYKDDEAIEVEKLKQAKRKFSVHPEDPVRRGQLLESEPRNRRPRAEKQESYRKIKEVDDRED